ncbi:MAG: TetR/AcrR family transcriptional regulator [Gammaproteobacteria bacterium]|nr:TetR/AcrR family transcriptional regulator [Gammaproteobacteria bacterium]MDH5799621.1 TetR/AcrR family transcriptional regulator [Gammaproteobacteria bacterium]
MAGPQKQFDTDTVLAKALEVFWRQGYELTSVQDLVKGMGINRASLYDTFGNKTQLYQQTLQRYIEQSLTQSRELLLHHPGTVVQRLQNYFYTLNSTHHDNECHFGCFLNNTAVELGPHYPQFAEQVRNAWTEMETIFRTLLEQGVKKQELPPHLDTAAIAATINMMLQGISVMSKAGVPKEQLAQIIATVMNLLHS